jgi:PAS domain S-box-containing protein
MVLLEPEFGPGSAESAVGTSEDVEVMCSHVDGEIRIARVLSRLRRVRHRLFDFAEGHSLDELLAKAIQEIGEFVGSPMGFYHFVAEDQHTLILQQFAGSAIEEFCGAYGRGTHRDIADAGVWADCISLRQAVIHNDYAALPHRKGLPPGHVPVVRELVVPVLREDKVVAIVGVANAPTDYTEVDSEIVAILADITWGVIRNKRTVETLRESEARSKALYDTMSEGVALHDLVYDEAGRAVDYRVVDVNRSYESILNLSRESVCGRLASDVYGTGDAPYLDIYAAVAEGGSPVCFETYFLPLDKHMSISVASQGQGRFATIFSDVSERSIAMETLRHRSEELEKIVANIPAMIVFMDANATPVWANRCFEETTGWHVSELTGPDCLAEFYPDPEELIRVRHFVRASNGRWGEFRTRVRDGRVIDTLWSNVPLRDGSIISMGVDITSRKLAEKDLREAALREREILRASNVGLWDWDLATNTVRYSAEWKRQIGYDEHEIGNGFDEWLERVHPDDLPAALARLHQAIDTAQECWLQFRLRHKDGSYRWILAPATVLLDESGRSVRMIGSHVDITEKMTAEVALRESEERYRRLVENLDDLVYRVELLPEPRISYISPSATKFTGHTPEEYYANFMLVLEGIHAEDRGRICPVLNHEAGNSEAIVLRYVHQDGRIVWTEHKNSRIHDASGALIAVEGIARDITERKRSEEERDRLEAQVRHAQKMEAIGQLTGGVAHDFNNLLQVINASTDMAREALEPAHAAYEMLGEVAQAGERAARLVSQLLMFGRRQIMRPEVLDLNDVTTHLLKMLGRLIGEHIRLQWIPGCRLGAIHADRGMVEQAVVNLSVNARDAMPEGGILTIEARQVTLDEAFRAAHTWAVPGVYARLSVTDTGCGMTAEILEHIFEPFFTTKQQGKGTGLGLATVYGIVKQHEGLIQAISTPGRGSTFNLYWPICNCTASATHSVATAKPSVQGGSERVLLAEDEPMVRRLARLVLEKSGYKVITAENGADALAIFKARQDEIDLVILDLVMPVMGGRDACEAMRVLRPELKVVFASGYSEDALDGRFTEDRSFTLIQKPFLRDTLLAAVRKAIDCSSD